MLHDGVSMFHNISPAIDPHGTADIDTKLSAWSLKASEEEIHLVSIYDDDGDGAVGKLKNDDENIKFCLLELI